MRRTLALITAAASLAACVGTSTGPTAQPGAATPALTPVPGGLATPRPPATDPATASDPAITPADGDVRVEWAPVAEPDIRPKRGFEHAFLESERGALVLVRHLAGEATTIVATTRDGVDWITTEVPSGAIPAGREVNGGSEWLQLVDRSDGRLELVASTDGLAWEPRGILPRAIDTPWASAVNGTSILVCGSGSAPREGLAACASAPDGGATWTELVGLGVMTGMSPPVAVPLRDTFVVVAGGPGEFEATAWTTSDGMTWQRQPDLIPNAATELTAFDSMVLAVGRATEGDAVTVSIAVSTDGATWEPVSLPRHDGYVGQLLALGGALVAPATWDVPEGPTEMRDFLVSTDGRTWRAIGVPPELRDWTNPTFLPVEHGLLVMGDQPGQLMLGTVVPAAGAW